MEKSNKGIASHIDWQCLASIVAENFGKYQNDQVTLNTNLGAWRNLIMTPYVIKMEPKGFERKHVQQAAHSSLKIFFLMDSLPLVWNNWISQYVK